MFLEVENANPKSGWIEVVCGSMFSGKTEELIRRIRRAQIAQQKIMLFKPSIDSRYSEEEIVSHNQNTLSSQVVNSAQQILLFAASDIDVVGVDEAQFFDDGIVEVCNTLAQKGIRVIVAGLDMDFEGRPFGPIPNLMAIAEYVTKVHAICQQCGSLANYSYRLNPEHEQIVIGAKDVYEPRCRNCFRKAR